MRAKMKIFILARLKMELSQERRGKKFQILCKDFLFRPKSFETLLKIDIFSL